MRRLKVRKEGQNERLLPSPKLISLSAGIWWDFPTFFVAGRCGGVLLQALRVVRPTVNRHSQILEQTDSRKCLAAATLALWGRGLKLKEIFAGHRVVLHQNALQALGAFRCDVRLSVSEGVTHCRRRSMPPVQKIAVR